MRRQGANLPVKFDPIRLRREQARVRLGFWPKLKRLAASLPFSRDLLAAYYCAGDGDTPLYVKAVLTSALAYFVIPADMIPDFLAGIGYTDDATVLSAAMETMRRHITPGHRAKAEKTMKQIGD